MIQEHMLHTPYHHSIFATLHILASAPSLCCHIHIHKKCYWCNKWMEWQSELVWRQSIIVTQAFVTIFVRGQTDESKRNDTGDEVSCSRTSIAHQGRDMAWHTLMCVWYRGDKVWYNGISEILRGKKYHAITPLKYRRNMMSCSHISIARERYVYSIPYSLISITQEIHAIRQSNLHINKKDLVSYKQTHHYSTTKTVVS